MPAIELKLVMEVEVIGNGYVVSVPEHHKRHYPTIDDLMESAIQDLKDSLKEANQYEWPRTFTLRLSATETPIE